MVLICLSVIILSSGQQVQYFSLLEITCGGLLSLCVLCLLYLTAKYNIKYHNNESLKAFFGEKKKSISKHSSVVEKVEEWKPKRNAGFIFIIETYVLLTLWLDPLDFLQRDSVKAYTLATDVHVEQKP